MLLWPWANTDIELRNCCELVEYMYTYMQCVLCVCFWIFVENVVTFVIFVQMTQVVHNQRITFPNDILACYCDFSYAYNHTFHTVTAVSL